MTINDGVQYQVIFTGAGQQTADLFFSTPPASVMWLTATAR